MDASYVLQEHLAVRHLQDVAYVQRGNILINQELLDAKDAREEHFQMSLDLLLFKTVSSVQKEHIQVKASLCADLVFQGNIKMN